MKESFGGLAGWLLARMRRRCAEPPRLAVLERVALAPRQSLALVEAEGRRILVATSAEGGPAFYPLDGERRLSQALPAAARGAGRGAAHRQPRVSW
ncbi:MAG: flagellar biosynthetic protein FliO [Terracidiphilus sp.]